MAHNRDRLAPQTRRQQSKQSDQAGKRPQGVRKEQRPPRRSARLSPKSGEYAEQQRSPTAKKTLQQRRRGQKRSREAEDLPVDVTTASFSKRPRTSPPEFTATRPAIETPIDPVDYWRREQTWPKDYFEPEDTMNHLLARRKSTPSLRRKRSEGSLAASSITPSDQKPREEKSAPYTTARYEILLETKGSYMGRYVGENEEGVSKESKGCCQTLLETEQTIPGESMFEDEFFQDTCDMLRNRNEAKVFQDISRLIVPSAQSLAIRGKKHGAKHLRHLIESVNEGWNNSVPLTGTRPQPDYSVGFKREAFTEEQREKLAPFIGDFIAGDQSFFMATYYMYFPFLTCEVKCGAAALDIADRQNAHSMTLAVRAVVELFRLVKREDEINREILAFSVSHDDQSVRIYGHYAVIDGPKTTFYRHSIRNFSFQELEGREKWTAYKFTKNVYDAWMPTHFKRLCLAIDDLPPELDFDVAPLPQDSGLSQELESRHLSRSFVEPASRTGEDDSRSGTGDFTPNTSFTQQEATKRSRRHVEK
ncbi:hypothetical protein BDV95DRAFT_573569 [Massariosphaeria phaeospora]|uniref:DUF7924 domain-containing protein n=1 Tax=Massariosphaeria phaeospora TaxID=100035 RepID=A0A7C8I5D9_9PLEO|nr:hypothetical protein BDV95DRAFT_573569 [Massariosphaeria phaeospora]